MIAAVDLNQRVRTSGVVFVDCLQQGKRRVATKSPESAIAASTTTANRFVRLGARDNFYQSAAFIPMSFALVTTVNGTGETGIGPHALCYPFSVSAPYSMLLISRGSSGTATNLRRTGRCALNYVEFDKERLKAITKLGYPGQPVEAKRKANPFTLIPSPLADSSSHPSRPLIIAESVQVIECTWDDTIDLGAKTKHEQEHGASRFVLRVDNILLQERFRQGCVDGSVFPKMPIFYGFRADGGFWFAEHRRPFSIAAPEPPGGSLQAAQYLASRLDDSIRFTDDACVQLARVPRPFLSQAMQRLIDEARRQGRSRIDSEFMRKVGRERQDPPAGS